MRVSLPEVVRIALGDGADWNYKSISHCTAYVSFQEYVQSIGHQQITVGDAGPRPNLRLYSVQYTEITLLTNILAMFESPHIPKALLFVYHIRFDINYNKVLSSLPS